MCQSGLMNGHQHICVFIVDIYKWNSPLRAEGFISVIWGVCLFLLLFFTEVQLMNNII